MRSLVTVTIALLIALGATLVRAEDAAASADRQVIIEVILGQVEAFASEDDAGAWAFASEDIQARFGSPERFVAMVRSRYPAIYGAEALQFRELIPHPGFMIQPVRLRGPDGRRWEVFYRMSRQQDVWRISGVTMRPADAGI